MRDRGNITRLTVPFLLFLQIVWCYTASANWLRDADERMYHLIHDHRASPLDAVMPWVSRIGSGESEIVIAFILPIFGPCGGALPGGRVNTVLWNPRIRWLLDFTPGYYGCRYPRNWNRGQIHVGRNALWYKTTPPDQTVLTWSTGRQ